MYAFAGAGIPGPARPGIPGPPPPMAVGFAATSPSVPYSVTPPPVRKEFPETWIFIGNTT